MTIALIAVSVLCAALLVVIARMAWLMMAARLASLEAANAELRAQLRAIETDKPKRWSHRENLDIENAQAAFSAIRRELVILSDRVDNAMGHLGKLRGSRNGGSDD